MTRDELGQYLAETLDLYLRQDDVRSRPWFRQTVGDLLTHVDAYMQEDRERIAQAIEADADAVPRDVEHEPPLERGHRYGEVDALRRAARIARAES